ncbi:MAG: threonine--tRNA ligase [archaeon]|nr:threonine--tRNA ligase [archaeon]
MKILTLHVDYIEWQGLKKALKNLDEISKEDPSKKRVEEALVILTAVEKGDSLENIHEYIKNIIEISESVKTKKIVLYPYAHLSSNLGSPETAVEILKKVEEELKKLKYEVYRAPFGYYKTFELKVKGHPLSELSREIVVKGNEKDLNEAERKRLWKILSKNKAQAIRGKDGLKSNVELGKELDLYIVNEIVGQGLPLLTPKGASIKREIERFIVDEELKRGYEHTSTPVIAHSDLYKISGHWQHYKDGMFVLNVGKDEFALRPMTCPFQFVLYKRKPRSYKDLPKKYAEIATLFRNEQSGELRGLTRVRQFTLADAHIICTPEQLEKEFKDVVDLVKYVMKVFGIEITYRFSKWDPANPGNKYINEPKAWEETQNIMKKILDKLKINYVEKEGEAAFYGPKLDLQYGDVYGKEDTLITIQIDFSNAGKFGMTYLDKDGKEKMPLIIHRSSTGATERVISYLLEKTQGNLPLWLSPVQVRILPMSEKNNALSYKIKEKLVKEGIRTEVDDTNESLGKKVRNAQLERVFYMVTIGDKEESSETISLRSRDGSLEHNLKLSAFTARVKKEIKNRK